jgi:hypothetical protein
MKGYTAVLARSSGSEIEVRNEGINFYRVCTIAEFGASGAN